MQSEPTLHLLIEFLENNAFSDWVLVSNWGFAWLIALHSVGMGIAAGLGSAAMLRSTGLLAGIPRTALSRLFKVAWMGFWLNFFTGIALLVPRISEYMTDPTFLVKIGAVITAAICMARICKRISVQDAAGITDTNSQSYPLVVAGISCWILAVTAGRWIAYLSGMYG